MEDPTKMRQEGAGIIPTTTKTIQTPSEIFALHNERQFYDFDKCLQFLEAKGKELFGIEFTIYKEDYKVLYRLLTYIIGDTKTAKAQGLSLKKGIVLTGPIGCGKTSIMKLLRFMQPESSRYLVRSCRDISFAFMRDGFDVIQQYSNNYGVLSPQIICFDDLGTESSLKRYGNECNIMGEILLSRYEWFVSKGVLTHVTTNCNSSEIEKFYGNRVRSRMREMFNLVSFEKDAKDKRH